MIREVHNEFTYAFVNHVSSSVASNAGAGKDGKDSIKRDYSLMICYDHRINNDFGEARNTNFHPNGWSTNITLQ